MTTETETKEITNSEDMIDVRNVIARVEQLESELKDAQPMDDSEQVLSADDNEDLTGQSEELHRLTTLLEDLAGNGGDEEWRGAWHPLMLVRDSYFEDFAREEAESLDLVKSDARWPYTCIDWEQAARELQMDYRTVDFDGVTYWYR
jgi:hypothetical protein